MKIKGIAHIGVCVKNLENSLNFYNKVLGFKIVEPPSPMVDDICDGIALGFPEHTHRICLLMVHPGQYIELMEFGFPPPTNYKTLPMNQIGKHHISFLVDNIEEYVQKFREMKLEVNSDPLSYETAEGQEWWTIVKDPDGIEIELIQK